MNPILHGLGWTWWGSIFGLWNLKLKPLKWVHVFCQSCRLHIQFLCKTSDKKQHIPFGFVPASTWFLLSIKLVRYPKWKYLKYFRLLWRWDSFFDYIRVSLCFSTKTILGIGTLEVWLQKNMLHWRESEGLSVEIPKHNFLDFFRCLWHLVLVGSRTLVMGEEKHLGKPSSSKEASLTSFFSFLLPRFSSWDAFSLALSTTSWRCKNSAAVLSHLTKAPEVGQEGCQSLLPQINPYRAIKLGSVYGRVISQNVAEGLMAPVCTSMVGSTFTNALSNRNILTKPWGSMA